MRNVMVSGLPKEIHQTAVDATLDIMEVCSPDNHGMGINNLRGQGSTRYDATYAADAGGTLEITEKVDGETSREISLRGVLSAAAARLPAGKEAQFPRPPINGPHILEGTISFEPVPNRTVIDRLLGRTPQVPDKDLAEKAAADVIKGFRRAFSRSPFGNGQRPGRIL
jgi:hypothetical protein